MNRPSPPDEVIGYDQGVLGNVSGAEMIPGGVREDIVARDGRDGSGTLNR